MSEDEHVTILQLPLPATLWQEILWRARQDEVGVDEWIARALIDHCDVTTEQREAILRAVVAHAGGEQMHSDLPPAWLPAGVGLLPVETAPPQPVRVSLKNFRRHNRETGSFSASLYLHRRRIGTVSVDGSGTLTYAFVDGGVGDAYFEHVQAWGGSKGRSRNADAALVDELYLECEDLLDARGLLRGGAITVIAIDAGPVWLPYNGSSEPDYYEEHMIATVDPGETPEEVASGLDCHRWRIVASTDPTAHRTGWRARPIPRREHAGAGRLHADPAETAEQHPQT